MTLDDESVAEAFEQHEGAPTWQDDPAGRDAAVRWHMRGFKDGYAYRDAEVEELRAERDRLADALVQARDEALAVIEQVQLLADALVQARDERDAAWAGSNARLDAALAWEARAEKAEATLAKVREWAEVSDRPHIESWDLGYEHATIDVLTILDESPTERETPADEWECRRWDRGAGLWFDVAAECVSDWMAAGYEVQRRRKAGPWMEVVPDDRA